MVADFRVVYHTWYLIYCPDWLFSGECWPRVILGSGRRKAGAYSRAV